MEGEAAVAILASEGLAQQKLVLSFEEGVWPRPVHFSHLRVRVDVGKGGVRGQIESSAS